MLHYVIVIKGGDNMQMLLIDVKNNKIKPVDVNGLDDYYKYIGCRCIDIVRRNIGGKYFEIIIDDEGWLVNHPIPSAIDKYGEVMLVGNLLIAGGDVVDGEFTGITDSEIIHILQNGYFFVQDVYEEWHNMLTVEY